MLLAKCDTELTILERDKAALEAADAPFKIMTHREAIDYLRSGSEITHGSRPGSS